MACMHKPYNPENSEDRRRVITSAIASQRLEGLELDDESLADLDEFIAGTVDLNEVKERALARYMTPDPLMPFYPTPDF